MKCCMVACINILYPQNQLSAELVVGGGTGAVDRSAVLCFLRVSDHLVSICNFFFTENFECLNFCDDVIHFSKRNLALAIIHLEFDIRFCPYPCF